MRKSATSQLSKKVGEIKSAELIANSFMFPKTCDVQSLTNSIASTLTGVPSSTLTPSA
jgi:hypothetical protein